MSAFTVKREAFAAAAANAARGVSARTMVEVLRGLRLDVDAGTWRRVWGAVSAAVGSDKARPVLCSVLLDVSEGVLRMVTTDSYRLAVDAAPIKLAEATSLIVPGSVLAEVARLLKNGETVELARRGDKHASFTVGSVEIIGRLTDGAFPNWPMLIPESASAPVPDGLTFAREPMLAAAKRCAKLANGSRGVPVALVFAPDSQTVTLRFRQSQNGLELSEQVDGCAVSWPEDGLNPVEIGLSPHFFVDALQAFDSERLQACVLSPLRPVVFKDPESPEALHLLMPIRLAA
jgi:DNA polymerase-3 subunit beta